ncbi:unnamed protein product [Ilex paraguariensis]|uniref:Protein kinase domain-containing protein n=1 Tax=Ilex paraguariensis TaxID=185542 RepID=A0ABC8QNI6_9AQUA
MMEKKKKFPVGAEHYTLYEEVGQGVSASVHRALCIPFHEIVAIKILDFERDHCDLNHIFREVQLMTLVDHPNVLKSHCSFVSDHNLWVVMPYMDGGSCLHILKAAYPDGFEEVVIATILREVLKGLEYLHQHGHIHRDVKAGNILIDARSGIKLGDFGVSACLFDSGDRQRRRNTFVGTPCWMAPEVMEQLHGPISGLLVLELAHGHAPFSKYPPMKVLLMTLQNAPPGLYYEKDKKFSKSFKQMIATCLVKYSSKRPSAKKLLKHSFFKQAKSNDYITQKLLDGLPVLGDRIQALKRKEEDLLAQKKIPDVQKEEMSQNEYKRGISCWTFDLEDVKAQASLIPDECSISDKDQIGSLNSFCGFDMHEKKLHYQLSYKNLIQNQSAPLPSADSTPTYTIAKFEKFNDEVSITSSTYEHLISQNSSPHNENHIGVNMAGKPELDISGRNFDGMATHSSQRKGGSSDSIHLPDLIFPPCEAGSDKVQSKFQNMSLCNGIIPPTMDDGPSDIISRASKPSANIDEPDEKAKCSVVQQKGRFKVTSENVDLEKVVPSPILQKSRSMQVITQRPPLSLPSPSPSDATPPNPCGHSVFPTLQSALQTNILQKESLLSLMKQVSVGDSTGTRAFDGECLPTNVAMMEKSLHFAAGWPYLIGEKELLHVITDLQWRLICAQEELQKYKTENARGKAERSCRPQLTDKRGKGEIE